MIKPEHPLSVKRQAELLGVSRGSVYYLPRGPSATDLALMRMIDELHLEHPFVGARMLRAPSFSQVSQPTITITRLLISCKPKTAESSRAALARRRLE